MQISAPGSSLSFSRTKGIFFFFSFYLVVYILLACISEGTYETGDSINHYLISRYSFLHPELFLHHWGKPFFTLLSSPFSQFGFLGIKIFNILCGGVALYFTFKLCEYFKIENSYLVFALVLLTPVYSRCLLSGLTEPLFSAVLMAAIYFFLIKKIIPGSLLFALLPFIRTEGFLLLVIPFLYLVLNRYYRVVILLGVPFIVYSVIGYFVNGDLLWIAHQNPYKGAAEVYGHGGMLHFIRHYSAIWGLPVFILMVVGAGFVAKDFLKKNLESPKKDKLFVYSFFIIYFLAHVIFWWKGLFGSIGTVRVIAGVMPVASILALEGYNFLTDFTSLKLRKFFVTGSVLILIVWFIGYKTIPVRLSTEEKVIREACNSIAQSNLSGNKFYYFYPWISVLLNRDIFDKNLNEEPWGFHDDNYVKSISDGSLIIWDSHFSANEAKISKDEILSNKNFSLIKQFRSPVLWTDLDKSQKYFEVLVFSKVSKSAN